MYPTDKFYNMQVNLVKNGRVYPEKAAIRNIWQKDRNFFLDIYIYRLQKAFVFDAAFVRDISDMSRGISYKDINKFAADFAAAAAVEPVQVSKTGTADILSPVKDDVILLLFMSKVWNDKNPIKQKIIFDYIQSSVAAAKNLSERYLSRYLAGLQPADDDFYNTLNRLKSKKPSQALRLLQEAVKICLVGGYLHYNERMYLADFIQALRQEGVEVPPDVI